MNITLFGASGRVGQLVLSQLLAKNHSVTAFVHGSAPFEPSKNLTIIKGDIHSDEEVASALQKDDLVISCLGSWGTPNKDILSSAMERIAPAMEARGISRIISLTGSGAFAPNDSPRLLDRINRAMLLLIAPEIVKDSEAHMATLAQSTLEWTVLRSPVMTPEKVRKHPGYKLSRIAPFPLASIARRAVATAMVDQIDDVTWMKQAPHLRRR